MPSFAMTMLSAGITGVEARQADVTEEPEREDRVIQFLTKRSLNFFKSRKEAELPRKFVAKEFPSLNVISFTTMRPAVASTSWKQPSVPTGRMSKNAQLSWRQRTAASLTHSYPTREQKSLLGKPKFHVRNSQLAQPNYNQYFQGATIR